ncbi:MAG TPA: UDP-N-acetylmuramoyl-tripeptide--D-alanyl-D-alanine ligase [Candidatus Babeliales bacterium]|nr:UDP-N-acetylmuramoyl-tripeptide--D-alanyl-D-alanine ligase [Candidatus Babeliales bacterium]
MNLPLEIAIAASEATIYDGGAAPAALACSTDTRTIAQGDTFIALRGERFDGHAFTEEAVRRGAAMLVVDRIDARVDGVATLLVGDTKAAYMAFAGAARGLFRGRVVAITGSAGKTTTKSFLAQLLEPRYGNRILATPENENNEIGVSKLLLAASNSDHDILIVEMGARRYGDVAELVDIARPQLGILTNVGEAHLEIMGSRERLEETKWALFARGARAVLNAFDDVSRRRARTLAQSPHWFASQPFALDDGMETLTALTGTGFLLHSSDGITVQREVELRVPGDHNRANAAAAAAGALEIGIPLEELPAELPRLRLPQGRYDRLAARNGLRLIYDAYNANASGMIAALDAFGSETASRRIAVLASMAELGEESEALHERVGAHAAALVDVLLVRGDYADELARGASRAGLSQRQIVRIGSNAQAAQWLREHASAGDVVLLKGSRKYKLEEIVEELRT